MQQKRTRPRNVLFMGVSLFDNSTLTWGITFEYDFLRCLCEIFGHNSPSKVLVFARFGCQVNHLAALPTQLIGIKFTNPQSAIILGLEPIPVSSGDI